MAPGAEDSIENGGAADVLTRDFMLLFIASFFLIGSLYLLIPVLPLYMVDAADATTTQVGLLIGVLTFASFLLRPYVGRKSDEIGRKPFLVVGAAIFVVATLLYIPARSLWTLPFVLAFNGIGVACFHTASLTFIGDIAPTLQRGRSQAWFQSSFNIAAMACPPLGVLLKDSLGYKWVFIAASLAAANGFPLLCVSAVVWGAGFAFASPAFSAMLMDRVPREELGRAFGIYTTAFEGGIVFGAMAMGPVVSTLGFRMAFVVIGGVCLAGAAVFVSAYNALAPQTPS